MGAPLLLLDRLWQFIYSQIPLKDGLHHAPEFVIFNALCVCGGAALLGAWADSKGCALTLAIAAALAVLLAVWVSAADVPTTYVVTLALAVPASTLLTFAWRTDSILSQTCRKARQGSSSAQ